MSELDRCIKILEILRLQRENNSKEFSVKIEQLEGAIAIEKDAKWESLFTLTKWILLEMHTREGDDIAVLNIASKITRDLVKDIDILRNLIMPLLTNDESIREQLESLEKRVKDRLEFDKKLDKYLQEWKKDREKEHKKLKDEGLYI